MFILAETVPERFPPMSRQNAQLGLIVISTPKVAADSAMTDEVLTLPGTILGTLDYMSPEQASGYAVDFRSDQFSLGGILFEMTTGVVRFARDTVPRTLAAIIEGRPAGMEIFRHRVPQSLRAIIERALAKRPEERFPSMRELAKALREKRLRRFVTVLRSRCESLVGMAR